jgi:hypothetical protein
MILLLPLLFSHWSIPLNKNCIRDPDVLVIVNQQIGMNIRCSRFTTQMDLKSFTSIPLIYK